MSLLDIQQLHRSFGAVHAVNDLNLRVEAGQIYGLVGPDGAGKTTTLRMLCGALLPDSGEIFVDGISAVKQIDQVRRLLGYMPQRFSLYGDLSVGENLRFFATIFGVSPKEQKTRIAELLAFSRLEQFEQRQARRLSGGMKQKLALACALMHQPRLLLLDEPTTGVDPVSRREFWEIVRNAVRNGMTVFVSTPYMDEAERCHRLAFMANGQILAEGTPKELQRQIEGEMLEIKATPQRQAFQLVQQHPAVLEALVFGELIHANLRPDYTLEQLVNYLRDQDITIDLVRTVTPSMEDVFLHLTKQARQGVEQ